MTLLRFGASATGLGVFVCLGLSAGCQDSEHVCELNLNCPPIAAATSTASGGGGGGGSGGDGGGGSDPGNCDPQNGPLNDLCGVFVSATMGDDLTGAGSQDLPWRSLAKAITAAETGTETLRVYACAEVFAEAATITKGVTIYGGLDCANDWAYVGATTKSEISAPSDVAALRITSSASGFSVEDFRVRAADAIVLGGSSVGVLVDGATGELARCEVIAGAGAVGAPGTTPMAIGPNNEGANGPPGDTGLDGCVSAASNAGGLGGQNTCGGVDVSGGLGGNGTNQSSGGAGGNGKPQPGPAGTEGLGGKEQDASPCGSGVAGANGSNGTSGPGAVGLGTLNSSGVLGVAGEPGATSGAAGQGAGGGGGAKMCANSNAGPSGGGGGAGGCGGQPGTGGGPGGASIGIAAVNATLKLTSTSVTTSAGGDGGTGGNGQPGGFGGQPGTAGSPGGACVGGQGGTGGRGGSGGGGLGGHSIAVAFLGAAPEQKTTTLTTAKAGDGGVGGDADASVSGASGLACKTLDFANAGSCTP